MSEPSCAVTASILHADLDAFYASVEQRDHPSLRGRPVIVGGGVVLAASYEAKRAGVETAMTTGRARSLCPHAVVVTPRFEAYADASRRVFAIFDDTTPLVEGLSIDEAFLDVGGLGRISGPPLAIGAELRRRVRDEVGLAISVGVARTKFLAKVASSVAKPDGLLVVPPDGEETFLLPLPVERLWGVGAKTAAKLHRVGIATVGDVARLSERDMCLLVGVGAGRHLHALAHNRDPRRVETGRRRRSIGSQQALGRRARSRSELEAILQGIVDRVMRRLRSGDRLCRTVVLRLRFGDYSRATRSRTLPWPTDATETVRATALDLFAQVDDGGERGLTLIGVAVTNLSATGAVQLELPLHRDTTEVVDRRRLDERTRRTRRESLDRSLDDLRERFGNEVMIRASLADQYRSVEVPKLPE